MKQKFIILFIVFFSVLSSVYLVKKIEERRFLIMNYQKKNDSLENVLSTSKYQLADYRDRMSMFWENEGLTIDNKTKVIVDGKESFLHAYRRKKRLFVRISTSNCWSCIKTISEYINKNADRDDIVYLLDVKNENLISELKTYAELRKPIIITKSQIQLPVESMGEPYIFYMDEQNAIHMVLMPIKGDELLLNSYLKSFKTKTR